MSIGCLLRSRRILVAGVLMLVLLASAFALPRASRPFGHVPGQFQLSPPGERPIEVIGLGAQLQARASAPYASVAPGAAAAAIAQKDKLLKQGGAWTPVGQTPMRSDDPTYSISQLGHGTLSGRATAFADDP